MENKINIAELLKDCPSGMELDSPVYYNLTFDYINEEQGRIYCKAENRDTTWFTIYGCASKSPSAKCVIYPKGKTTWEGFIPPCGFKDGDIITCGWNEKSISYSWTCILKKAPEKVIDNYFINDYCSLDCNGGFLPYNSEADSATWVRFATDEEKEKLFKAIKENGYKWNAETKTLERVNPQYPKTYVECANMLNCFSATYIDGYKYKSLEALQELLICRDAYWKLAGDWKYDVNKTEEYFYIVNKCGRIVKEHYVKFNYILAFPTEEMRDAFYENFKNLIEACKELL